MINSNSSNQEFVGEQLTEEISKFKQFALGEGAVVCQVCGSELEEGTPITVYAFRPAGESVFEVGQVRCAGGSCDAVPECFTLGVRELVVAGRVGWCSDAVTQSSWPILIAPRVLAVSATATRSLRWLADEKSECKRDAVSSADRSAELDGPDPLIEQMLQSRVEETRTKLDEYDVSCGGERR